ncbi:Thiol:disulfide interchange protein DsbA [Duganella sp. CF458]|uniref:thiol:disulfide interchange protein DsbA/DsbL n=1 Tax=Duganella sp. CF458 TaxID=1884368 RepID=UPI0008F1DD95|nr:thiol:disulfide interchange protein DsbA/DsbL [Duganella sp. CF458]SFG85305.1 Thiol:disulfide interchange protein DsbA [Duganella sp. CF458]
MKLFKQILATVLCSVAFGAVASPAAPVAGTDYVVLPEPQTVDTGKKVEVIEFFAYYCPHCNALEPAMAAWVKKQGDNVAFKRIHVSRGPTVLPQQKLYFALEAMGLVEQYHAKVFNAMHEQGNSLRNDTAVIDWAASNGIDKTKFTEAYNSFGVAAKLRRTERMMGDYRVDYWPMLVVDGKYMTSPAEANKNVKPVPNETQQHANALTVLDFLVSKAKAEKK